MSTPTLHVDALQADPSTPSGLRLRVKPPCESCGFVQGAWWPRSRRLTTELPALLSALSRRFGHIDQVVYDESEWARTPSAVDFADGRVILKGLSDRSTNTISVIGAAFGEVTLLVVPPYSDPAVAYASVIAAADLDNESRADELLGIDAHTGRARHLALLAQQRWESEVGTLRSPGM